MLNSRWLNPPVHASTDWIKVVHVPCEVPQVIMYPSISIAAIVSGCKSLFGIRFKGLFFDTRRHAVVGLALTLRQLEDLDRLTGFLRSIIRLDKVI
jgi:hypothetical protein